MHDKPGHEVEYVFGDILPPLFHFLLLDVIVLVGVVEPRDGPVFHVTFRDSSFRYRRVGGIPGDIVYQFRYVPGGRFVFGKPPSVDIVAKRVFFPKVFEERIHFTLLVSRTVGLEIGVDVVEERIPEGNPEEIEMEIVVFLELAPVIKVPFCNQYMDVWVPFHVPAERVQEVDVPKPPLFLIYKY